MKILILGAGQVGTSVAAALASENNDITVVDNDIHRLRELSEKLDIRTVAGHASLPSVLSQAGADEAELLVAVTSSDEVNLVACQVAAKQFKTRTRVARLREAEYLSLATEGGANAVVNTAISPEQLVCKHIKRLIEYPGALQVLDFADGRAQLVAVRAVSGGALVG
ncbi:MAG TPA: NAD-binding protein, partial [Arenimonas sp.]|nr:NAD-binding protein [Arenimonas sp.]